MMNAFSHSGPASRIGRRGNSRLRLHVPALLVLVDGRARCLLDDISRTGARLAIARPVIVGEDAVLRCGAIECFGRIVWAEADACGLEFDEPLDKATLLGMREVGDHIAEAEIEQRRRMAREWVAGLR